MLRMLVGHLLRRRPDIRVDVPRIDSISVPVHWALHRAGRHGVRVVENEGGQAYYDPYHDRIVIGRNFPGAEIMRIHAALHEAAHATSPRWRLVAAVSWWAPVAAAATFGFAHALGAVVVSVLTGIAVRVGIAFPEEIRADRLANAWLRPYLESLGLSDETVCACEIWASDLIRRDVASQFVNAFSEVLLVIVAGLGGWALRP